MAWALALVLLAICDSNVPAHQEWMHRAYEESRTGIACSRISGLRAGYRR